MGKLIRDKIPEIMKQKGTTPVTHIANDAEYWQKLKAKLVEESAEFMKDEKEEELADVLEVFNTICDFKKIDKNKLEQIRKKKADERGSFSKRLILD